MDAHKPSERTRDTLAPSGFTQQVGAVLRFVQHQVGGEVIVGLAIINIVLWVLLRPPGVAGTMYLGEIFATTAIVLLSCSLVLATRAPLLERFFGGLDRMYLWHRWSAVAVAAVGTAAYVYRELFLRFFSRRWQYDYAVKAINRLDPRALEVILAPTARPLQFVAGQFVFVHFGGSAEWERHPFTVSSAPQERDLRLSIEALGDYTQHLRDTLQPGAPAIVSIRFA